MVDTNAMTDGEIETLLQARREELQNLIDASHEASAPVQLDQTQQGRLSRMDAIQQQAMADETRRRRLRQIKMIEAALQRLADGDYGYCIVCGEEIEAKRLLLDAALPTCVAHAK